MEQLVVEAIERDDISRMQTLRREALATAPFAFGASAEGDSTLDEAFVARSIADASRSVILLALGDGRPVGMVGAFRQPQHKSRHRAQIWGMYVSPSWRHRGVGEQLLAAVLKRVQSWPDVKQVELCVTSGARGARRLYERAGFRVWGCQPAALRWKGASVDEYHMVLRIDASER